MNKMVEIDGDSLPLARFDRDAVIALHESGVLPFDRPVEMIDGVLIEISPAHHAHAHAMTKLVIAIRSKLQASSTLLADAAIYLAKDPMLTPDLVVLPPGILSHEASGSDPELVVEISDAALRRDVGPKARDYAQNGVSEYWIVDINNRKLHIHRDPGPAGYHNVVIQCWSTPETALLIPGLTLTLSEILAP